MSKVRRTNSLRRKRVKPDAKAGKPLTPEARLTASLPRKRARPDARVDANRAFRKSRSSLSWDGPARRCNDGVRGDAVGDLR